MSKISSLGYFTKRLKDSGYEVYRLFTEYSEDDPRKWTIIIDPGNTSIICSCIENKEEIGEIYYELWDCDRYIPGRFKIKTESMEVFITYLVKFNINNKFEKNKYLKKIS